MQPFEVYFLDVGQGASTVIVLPAPDGTEREAIVIDSCVPHITIDCLRQRQVQKLRLVLITHNHEDHIKGIATVLREFVGRVQAVAFNIDEKNVGKKQAFQRFCQAIYPVSPDSNFDPAEELDAHTDSATLRQILRVNKGDPGTEFGWVLYPDPKDRNEAYRRGDTNLASAVTLWQWGGVRFLLGGDLTQEGWSVLLHRLEREGGPDIQAQVLGFPHHGAAFDLQEATLEYHGETIPVISLPDLLTRIQPGLIVISVGTQQPPGYQHPRPETLQDIAAHTRQAGEEGREVRLTCTELTPYCHPYPLALRQEALSWLPADEDRPFHAAKKTEACPCAGTVVVQVTQAGRWDVQPAQSDHQRFIDYIAAKRGRPGCRFPNMTTNEWD